MKNEIIVSGLERLMNGTTDIEYAVRRFVLANTLFIARTEYRLEQGEVSVEFEAFTSDERLMVYGTPGNPLFNSNSEAILPQVPLVIRYNSNLPEIMKRGRYTHEQMTCKLWFVVLQALRSWVVEFESVSEKELVPIAMLRKHYPQVFQGLCEIYISDGWDRALTKRTADTLFAASYSLSMIMARWDEGGVVPRGLLRNLLFDLRRSNLLTFVGPTADESIS